MKSKGERIIEKAESGLLKFGDDISELRRRLIILASIFLVLLIAGLVLTSMVMPQILSSEMLRDVEMHVFSPMEGMMVYMQFATVFAVALTIPFAVYHIWRFISPGLTGRERVAALTYIPFAFISFIVGLLFSYFIIFPSVFYFTANINANLGLQITYGISEFFAYLSNILLLIALIFEMPVVVMFLSSLGILTPKTLKTCRKYAYIILIILATAITPPDFITDILVMVPLAALYELSILLSVATQKKRKKAAKEREAEPESTS